MTTYGSNLSLAVSSTIVSDGLHCVPDFSLLSVRNRSSRTRHPASLLVRPCSATSPLLADRTLPQTGVVPHLCVCLQWARRRITRLLLSRNSAVCSTDGPIRQSISSSVICSSGQWRTQDFLKGDLFSNTYSGQKDVKNQPYVNSLSSCRLPQSTHIAKS